MWYRVALQYIGKLIVIGLLIAAGGFLLSLGSCYHGNPNWPTDPTNPPPPFPIDPCQDPFFAGPCPPQNFLKKMDGGLDANKAERTDHGNDGGSPR